MTRYAKPAGDGLLQLSILDRLLLGGGQDGEGRQAQAQRLRSAVRRDLEALFNTRPICRSWPRAMVQLAQSTLSYGLPDLQTRTVVTNQHREVLRADVEAVVRRFEPRLHDPVVELVDGENALERALRFRIHGRLVIGTGGEAVVYDTRVDPASREIRIVTAERDREAADAR